MKNVPMKLTWDAEQLQRDMAQASTMTPEAKKTFWAKRMKQATAYATAHPEENISIYGNACYAEMTKDYDGGTI